MMPQANADGLWLVIPTYNEAENIVPLLSAILQTLPDAHLLVVDDASPDGTAERVAAMQRHFERVHLLRRSGKLGYATAIVTGLEFALRQGATIAGHMDADFSHDPQRLPAMLKVLRQGADIAIGSRYVTDGGVVGWSLFRRILSRGANFLVRAVLNLPVKDSTSGFRLYHREALQRLALHRLRVEGYGFLFLSTALAVWNGLKVVEVPIVFVDRRRGKSKLSRRIIAEATLALVKVWLWRQTGRWWGKPLWVERDERRWTGDGQWDEEQGTQEREGGKG
jgi:dolichol-phosphate mannosyltransferase